MWYRMSDDTDLKIVIVDLKPKVFSDCSYWCLHIYGVDIVLPELAIYGYFAIDWTIFAEILYMWYNHYMFTMLSTHKQCVNVHVKNRKRNSKIGNIVELTRRLRLLLNVSIPEINIQVSARIIIRAFSSFCKYIFDSENQ